jgi:hypothetical protein
MVVSRLRFEGVDEVDSSRRIAAGSGIWGAAHENQTSPEIRRKRGPCRMRFRLIHLLLATAILAIALATWRWWQLWSYVGEPRVAGTQSVIIVEIDDFGVSTGREVTITAPERVRKITKALAGCRRQAQPHDCIPAFYRVELRKASRIVAVHPSACCGIFGCDGKLFCDTSGAFRYEIQQAFFSEFQEDRQEYMESMSNRGTPDD